MTGTGFFPLGREEAYAITGRRALPRRDERGAARQHALRRRHSTPARLPLRVRRHLAVLPARGRRARQGHARASTACTSSRRSSRWSSACPTRRSPRRSTTSSSATPRRSSRSSRSRTASRSRAPARSASARRASTRSSRGCPAATRTARRTRARRSATSRRAARTSACACADGSLAYPYTLNNTADREPAHPHPAAREPPERGRLGDAAEGARAVHARPRTPGAAHDLKRSRL